MRKMKCFKALAAALLIVVMLCGSAMAATMGAKVFSSSMAVYNSNKQRVGRLSRGTSISVTSISGDWAKFSYRGRTGYAKLSDIVFNDRIKVVSTKATSIRFITKSSYKKNTYYTGTLSAGVTLYVAGISGKNYLFYNESGSVLGYVSKSAVRKVN